MKRYQITPTHMYTYEQSSKQPIYSVLCALFNCMYVCIYIYRHIVNKRRWNLCCVWKCVCVCVCVPMCTNVIAQMKLAASILFVDYFADIRAHRDIYTFIVSIHILSHSISWLFSHYKCKLVYILFISHYDVVIEYVTLNIWYRK